MARAGDTYSRVVAWLKVLLPLIALGLLSTVFLFSRDIDPGFDLPVSQSDLRDRAQKLQVTNPYFSGTSRTGAQVSLFAEAARPAPGDTDEIDADAVETRILLTDGTRVMIRAERVALDPAQSALDLVGGVALSSSSGYTVRTERMTGTFDPIYAETEGLVEGDGPAGSFSAGKMTLKADPDTGDLYLNFTQGVKLVYLPQQEPE